MSIYFDFDVGPKGRRFRRATDIDRFDIDLFWEREQTDVLFGEVDLGGLIELSTLSICMINENKEVVGFVALCDYPNVHSVEPSDWETWVRNLYQKFYLSRNTLFVHFMCWEDSVDEYFLEEALVAVFMNDFYLQYIVLVVPMFCPDEIVKKFLKLKKRNILKILPKTEDKIGNSLYTVLRQDICPKLKMRRAVEEDNDDIVEILDKQCARLKDLYGQYYISEIISRHPVRDRRIVVADSGGHAVGVICLNTDINYKKLQKLYELRPFYGLRKATPLEKEKFRRANNLLKTFGEPILQGKWSPFDTYTKLQSVAEDDHQKGSIDSRRSKKMAKVNFKRNAAMRRSLDHIMFNTQHSDDFSDKEYMGSPSASQATVPSIINLLDEDPFDYEIVNIDSNLLTLPEVMSCELLGKRSLNMSKQSMVCKAGKCSITKKRKPQLRSIPKEDSEPVMYRGGQNAFMIELFALRDDIDGRYALDLLEAAFEITKDYDYCIIRVPSADKTFPLLQHFTFVPTRPHVNSKYSLYLAHRCSVLGKLRVREVEFKDIPSISRMMQNLDGKETIWSVENSIKKHNQAYVLTSGMSLVGLGILEPPEQIEFIRGRFNLDSYHIHKYHYRGHGIDAGFTTLKFALVYPAFEVHFRFFLREMMRLSGSNAVMWLTAYRNKWAVHKANCLVTAMVPLVPRPFVIDCSMLPELGKINALTNNIMAFSTWFICKKFTSLPKVNINSRIVIVGASKTALGFLNALLFDKASTYLTFTNITLISPNGLPYARHSKPSAESMFPESYITSDKYMKSVPYTYYVNIVQGTMMEIDRQKKAVTLTSGSQFHYDLLFLFFGKQYQHPDYMAHLLEREKEYQHGKIPRYIRLDVPHLIDSEVTITSDETPENVFIMNNIAEANRALKYVKNLLWVIDYNIIVYGASIEAYCCINALIDSKIPPENIIFVEPFPSENPKKMRVPIFCNTYVDHTVREVLENLKVTVYRSYHFQNWNVTSDNIVTHVEFLSHFDMLRLECAVFFYYGQRGVNAEAFVAVNRSGLRYDGGLVVDLECCTSDPSIYAAGPATRYHRKYYAPSYQHKYYDSYEVGNKLGGLIRNKLDPLFTGRPPPMAQSCQSSINSDCNMTGGCSGDTAFSNKSNFSGDGKSENTSASVGDVHNMRLISLTKPRVIYCTLPGNLKYLEVRAPGMKTPHHYVQSLRFNGVVMETFKGGYFKLHLTRDQVVDGVTCLSPVSFPLENFQHLYGKPATVLNNVHLRYTANKLDNFYEFFRLPWAYFLYHDHADDLFSMVKELLPKPKGRVLKEALHEIGSKLSNPTLRLNTKLQVRATFDKSAHVAAINNFVMDWLSQNDVLLPMYLQPWQATLLNHDQERNPMFTVKKKSNIKNMLQNLF